jgi:hypothetical protein
VSKVKGGAKEPLPRFLRFGDLDFSSTPVTMCLSVYDHRESPPFIFDGTMRLCVVLGWEQRENLSLDTFDATRSMAAHNRLLITQLSHSHRPITSGHSEPIQKDPGRKVLREETDTRKWEQAGPRSP